MRSLPKTATNPAQLRAIVDLRRAGWSRPEIMECFGISEVTYYRRIGEIRRLGTPDTENSHYSECDDRVTDSRVLTPGHPAQARLF